MVPVIESSLRLDLPRVQLQGDLALPAEPRGLVIFAHGSGSSRFSARNRAVAATLQHHGFATLLFDLLTEVEDQTYENRFDIELLAQRLHEVTLWLRRQNAVAPGVPIGYFGASTGAAAALWAATMPGVPIAAVVSRGGRPDLAASHLSHVRTPTLLIVGGHDEEVLALNRQAYMRLAGIKELTVIPRATHLFEEAGALEKVAQLACEWFVRHCTAHDGR
jgi:putative phosphoribosyl transferase